jgi:hypothetical protein
MPTGGLKAEKLTLREINRLIALVEWRFKNVGKSSLRLSAFKRLIHLEQERERLHGVPAPTRRQPR